MPCASGTNAFFSGSEQVDTIWANRSLETIASAWSICVVGLCDDIRATPPRVSGADPQCHIVSVVICTGRVPFTALVERLELVQRRDFDESACPILCLLVEDDAGREQALAWVFERITAQTYVLTSEHLHLDAFALRTAATHRVEAGQDCLQVDLARFEHGGFRFDVGDYVSYRTYAKGLSAAVWPPRALGSLLLAPDLARHGTRILLDAPNAAIGEAVALLGLLAERGPIVQSAVLIGSREPRGPERWHGVDREAARAYVPRLVTVVSVPGMETSPALDLTQVYGAVVLGDMIAALSPSGASAGESAELPALPAVQALLRDRATAAVTSDAAAFEIGGVIADALQLRGLAHLELDYDEVERHIVRVLHDASLAGRFGRAQDALEPLLARLATVTAKKFPAEAQEADLAWTFMDLVREARRGTAAGADDLRISRATLGRLEGAMRAFCETEQTANLHVERLEAQLAETRAALGEMYPGRLLLLLNRGIRGSWRDRVALPWRLARLVGRVFFIERRGLAWLRGRAARRRT